MKRIPDKIKIGGHEITVKLGKLEEDLGQFDWNTNTITISEDLPESQQQNTLLHEAMHVMVTSFDNGMGHAFMDSLSGQLYQFLKDNKICFCEEFDCDAICKCE